MGQNCCSNLTNSDASVHFTSRPPGAGCIRIILALSGRNCHIQLLACIRDTSHAEIQHTAGYTQTQYIEDLLLGLHNTKTSRIILIVLTIILGRNPLRYGRLPTTQKKSQQAENRDPSRKQRTHNNPNLHITDIIIN